MADFTCDIVTPSANLASEEVEMVVVPGIEGEMGFLKGHATLVSVLADGVVRITTAEGASKRYALEGGYVEVTGDKVIILANRAVASDDVDVNAVREQLSSIESQLAEMSEEEANKTTLGADKAWCEAQIKATSESTAA